MRVSVGEHDIGPNLDNCKLLGKLVYLTQYPLLDFF